MKKILLALLIAPVLAFSQARMVINGTSAVTVIEHGGTAVTPVYIEINNPAVNAITTVSTNGWIISEAEFDMLKWDIGTAAGGTYTVPWGLGLTYNLPLSIQLTGGSAGGSVLFSTYHTAALNSASKPSDVTNMGAMNPGGQPSNADNSYNVVDRFWIIDTYKGAFAYAPKPTANDITFTYAHTGASAEYAVPNVNPEADLIAQRFNSGPDTWGDWLGSGAWASAGNVATFNNTVAVTPANFFRSWTLSNSINPLPVELSSFTAQCDNGAALIQWTTQSELNNDYFTLEKTTDNIHFEQVGGNIPGAGTTSMPSNYSVIDPTPYSGQYYYVLLQTNIDGNPEKTGNPIEFNGCNGDIVPTTTINAFNTTNNIQVQINSAEATNLNILLVNMLGQTIYSQSHAVVLGNNEISLPNNLTAGVYILNVKNEKVNYSQKLIIGVK